MSLGAPSAPGDGGATSATEPAAIETGVTSLGVFLVFLSSLASTWGVFLQKIAQERRIVLQTEREMMSEEELATPEAEADYRKRVKHAILIWVLGLTLLIVLSFPKLKGSIGEGSNHSNFSDRSSIRILSKE